MMGDGVDIEIDADINDRLRTFPEIVAQTKEIADAVAERARDMAPVDTGMYRDGIIVEPMGRGLPTGYRVAATDQKSSWVEFGNSHQPAQWIVRNAAESLGLKFKKKGL